MLSDVHVKHYTGFKWVNLDPSACPPPCLVQMENLESHGILLTISFELEFECGSWKVMESD